MAKKITNEIIEQMFELYEELGTYSAVAKKLGVSASTVSKYIKEIECIGRTFQQRKLKGHMVSLCNSTKTLGNN